MLEIMHALTSHLENSALADAVEKVNNWLDVFNLV